MDKGGLRRSARLQKLRMKEMHIPLHVGQTLYNEHASAQRQGGKNMKIKDEFEFTIHGIIKEGHTSEVEVTPSHIGNLSRELVKTPLPSKMALEAILDLLQVKDSQDKLAMPANLEVENYEKRINNPEDFGTLRAKLKEKHYRTLEQFEDDIYSVTTKERISNPQDNAIYREVCSMEELAKEIFKNLKNHSEFEIELLNWLKDSIYSNKKKQKLTIEDGNDARDFNPPAKISIHMEQSSMAMGIASYEKPSFQSNKTSLKQNACWRSMAPSRFHGIEANGNSPGKRTRTYQPWANSDAANLHDPQQVAPVTKELDYNQTLMKNAKPGDGHLLEASSALQKYEFEKAALLMKTPAHQIPSSFRLPDLGDAVKEAAPKPAEFEFFPSTNVGVGSSSSPSPSPSPSRAAKSMYPLDWLFFSTRAGPSRASGVGSRPGSGQVNPVEGEPSFNWSDSRRLSENSDLQSGLSGPSHTPQVDCETRPGHSSELTTLNLFW